MQRVTGGRFAPGTSGNPGGRPPIPDDIKSMLKDLVPDSVKALHAAINGGDPRLAVQAASVVLDRVYGRPHQSASIETNTQSGPEAHLQALIAMASATQARIAAVEVREHDGY